MSISNNSETVVIHGYTVVPVRFHKKSRVCHYLYLKEHSVRGSDPTRPRDKTLFIVNVPPLCNKECLVHMFSPCGKIQKVYLHDKPVVGAEEEDVSKYFPIHASAKGFKFAYIVFKSLGAVQMATQLPYAQPLTVSTQEYQVITGMQKWCKEYSDSFVDVKELQEEVNTYMSEYDTKVELEKEKTKNQDETPDEDGWITVTKESKRHKAIPKTEAYQQRVKQKENKKEKELLNFYSFQVRESKMEHIAQLRKKFEEDKQKIQLLKTTRRFRPY